MIRNQIVTVFKHFADHPENQKNGSPDWSFVEADVMMLFGVDRLIEELGSLEQFYVLFNDLVDAYLLSEAA